MVIYKKKKNITEKTNVVIFTPYLKFLNRTALHSTHTFTLQTNFHLATTLHIHAIRERTQTTNRWHHKSHITIHRTLRVPGLCVSHGKFPIEILQLCILSPVCYSAIPIDPEKLRSLSGCFVCCIRYCLESKPLLYSVVDRFAVKTLAPKTSNIECVFWHHSEWERKIRFILWHIVHIYCMRCFVLWF